MSAILVIIGFFVSLGLWIFNFIPIWYAIAIFLLSLVLAGIRILRPTHRGVIETLGKYSRPQESGATWIVPFIQTLHVINTTEKMVDVEAEENYITKDNLNTEVDLVVFYRVKSDEASIKKAFYNVDMVEAQIVTLAQTTARNVIGEMVFKDVNSKRNELNRKLQSAMTKETTDWGVNIVRVELKAINPPKDVQETMNRVIKAQNEKQSAIDFATAKETEADGLKRANIKEAEGIAQGRKIVADANAYKIKIENESARKYFKAEAQKLKQLEVVQESLKINSKIILGADTKGILKLFDLNK